MKIYNQLHEIRYFQVKPKGWLKEILTAQKEGMPGHLDAIGYPFTLECWAKKSLTEGGSLEWWPYEQTAYWLDSMVRTSGLLEDDALYEKAGRQIDQALQFDDSFIGPVELKEHKRCYRWPVAVFARALYARWSFTGDDVYLEKLRDHYLNDSDDYSGYRDIVNVETMLRLYEYFDDARLLQKAETAYEKFDRSDEEYSSASAMLSDIVPVQHGVSYNEQAKLAAILYSYTGNERYLEAAKKGYDKLDRYAMLPDGVPVSCEPTYGNEIKWPHETCDIADYTWSVGYLLEATADAAYADRIERAVFNAAFGAIGPGFRTIQYFSAVNQVIAARNSTTVEEFKDTPRMAYAPHHHPECCVGNVGRIFPNYALRMYQQTEEGVCVSLYGDSAYEGEKMQIVQTGGYPFGDTVTLRVRMKKGEKAVLKLRIPCWAGAYAIRKNKEEITPGVTAGYAAVKVEDGDELELDFKKEFVSKESPDGGVYFEYGPFLLALRIDERWEVDTAEKRQTKDFPAYNLYPASAWNYCVSGKETPKIRVLSKEQHLLWDGVPFEIRIDARVLKNWNLEEKEPDRLLTPTLPDAAFIAKNAGDLETVTLVPYGCTNLRVAVFPKYPAEFGNSMENGRAEIQNAP